MSFYLYGMTCIVSMQDRLAGNTSLKKKFTAQLKMIWVKEWFHFKAIILLDLRFQLINLCELPLRLFYMSYYQLDLLDPKHLFYLTSSKTAIIYGQWLCILGIYYLVLCSSPRNHECLLFASLYHQYISCQT